MCLAVPALITKIEETTAEVDLGGVATRVSVLLTPGAQVGDYVIMHAGYALNILDAEEAEKTLRLLEQIAESDADG